MVVAALERVGETETRLAAELARVGDRYGTDRELFEACRTFSLQAEARMSAVAPWAERFGDDPKSWTRYAEPPDRLSSAPNGLSIRSPLPCDLWEAYRVVRECEVGWILLGRAAEAARERQLLDLVAAGRDGVGKAIAWLTERIDDELQRELVG